LDFGAGTTGDGFQYRLKFQPFVPLSLTEEWTLISRTILPYVYQEDVHPPETAHRENQFLF
jgi:hypothetical protein